MHRSYSFPLTIFNTVPNWPNFIFFTMFCFQDNKKGIYDVRNIGAHPRPRERNARNSGNVGNAH